MNIKNLIKSKFLRNKKDKVKPKNVGEEIACRFLKKQKYKIKEKNFRSRFGEVDIIAEDSGTLCFVEVKSRSRSDYGLPEEFVDSRKQNKIVKTSLTYINDKKYESFNARFDVVSVNLKNSECRLIRNAFEVGLF
ncbi:MAG: YraN family protein [Candidatus Dadabacteria bacterium]|nr:YraN family protein [Candidatus Dadabacteria bacterium]NIQ14854.1 YraN family protein [Candidatus Dadabacteria bacterium]